MSKVFQEIQDAEKNALQEVSDMKKSTQDIKTANVQKSNDILADAIRDADSSFENKVHNLEKELAEKKSKSLDSLQSEIDVLSKKSKSLIDTGVEFILSRFLTRA